jgi:hypothetical protein
VYFKVKADGMIWWDRFLSFTDGGGQLVLKQLENYLTSFVAHDV